MKRITSKASKQSGLARDVDAYFAAVPEEARPALEKQEEVDELWEKLSKGGEKQRCGWLKDKYGALWQVFLLR